MKGIIDRFENYLIKNTLIQYISKCIFYFKFVKKYNI